MSDRDQVVLDLPMQENDAGAATIREYLCELLSELWEKGEGFSGKRPFGNSGWDYELHVPLVKAGLIDGSVDEDGYLENSDRKAAHQIISSAIESLGVKS